MFWKFWGRLDKLEWAHENVKPWQVNKLKTLILNAKRRYWAAAAEIDSYPSLTQFD